LRQALRHMDKCFQKIRQTLQMDSFSVLVVHQGLFSNDINIIATGV
uniref:Obesity factor n=1 Tax=Hymenolepis diminuta TaxID=6216 RepID=A0A0R3SGM4_HYMDI